MNVAADATSGVLERRWRLHPRVALRPEPFGALAYHYDTRRLVFLRHPDLVEVVESLPDHPNAGAALDACGVAARRRPAFERALRSLADAGMLAVDDAGDCDAIGGEAR